MLLGVNIDHVATLRQQRHSAYPDPVQAALIAEEAGADIITLHLREDRRHIQDNDVFKLRPLLKTRMNLECAVTDEMIGIALRVAPHDVCLVPERRQELTTEGGLDVKGHFEQVSQAVQTLQRQGITVSLFIDPDPEQIASAAQTGTKAIELHTGEYSLLADAPDPDQQQVDAALQRIRDAVTAGIGQGLKVNAGHGLNYANVAPVAVMGGISELNIGHAIVARAVFDGWFKAVSDMKALLVSNRE